MSTSRFSADAKELDHVSCLIAPRSANDIESVAGSKIRPHTNKLDIQVLHVEGVVFDELAAGFYVFAHQRGENGFALGDVFELD